MEKYIVTFYPDDKKVVVDGGTTILSAAISAQIPLNSVCGGDGVCGRCRVIVKKGSVHVESLGNVSAQDRKRGVCLACQTIIESDISVEIPVESRLDLSNLSPEELKSRMRGIFSKAEDISEARPELGEGLFSYGPLVIRIYCELSEPNFDDKLSDLERLYRSIQDKIGDKAIHIGLANIRLLGPLLRFCDWKVTATLAIRETDAEIISIEPGDKTMNNYGLVFDIGTTTISGQLIDLKNKNILGTKVTYNPQATFGSDVITRIIYAQEDGGLEKLNNAVVDSLNEMIGSFVDEDSIDLNDILVVSLAGNTTMMHLLLRVDPTHIRQEPYVPTVNFWPVFKAAECDIKINPHGLLFCVPGVSSYVGGDITAGVLACNMNRMEDINLLIDVGTNGEIVLGNSQWLIGCAASAGPAFEGSGLSSGLRAVKGAIQSVVLKENTLDVDCVTIGNDKPRGICGSGYIDLLCQLFKHGILDKNGRLNQEIKNIRLRDGENGYEFVVVFANNSATGKDLVVTDSDLDNLKRAKAAIYSGISILVRHMDMEVKDICKVFVAGGFGTALNIESAIQIGLIPDLDRQKYVFVGNSSLAGARQYLMSSEAFKAAQGIADNITYFELSTDPVYMDEYMAALFFPHTDMSKFPSVKYK